MATQYTAGLLSGQVFTLNDAIFGTLDNNLLSF